MATIKQHHLVSREIPEESIEMNSPSKQSPMSYAKNSPEPYHDPSISPSTPTGCGYESEECANETTTQKKQVQNFIDVGPVTNEKVLKHTDSCTPAKNDHLSSHGKLMSMSSQKLQQF